jgi:hypothetical protein
MPLIFSMSMLVVLAGCRTDPAPDVHELTLFGEFEQRVAWFYGEPRVFPLAGSELRLDVPLLGEATAEWFVASALSVDGGPALIDRPSTSFEPPVEVRRIPLTTDLQMTTVRFTQAVLYFDGKAWFTLGTFDPAGLSLRVTPRPRLAGLRGASELTNAEADALQRLLEAKGTPLVVSFLAAGDVPRRAIDGVAEARASAVHISTTIETDVAAFRPAPRDLVFEIVARGQQAVGFERADYQLLRTPAELAAAWTAAHASSLTQPPQPSVDFARETMLAVFMGTRSSGGYGLDVAGVTFEGGDLFVDLVEIRPEPGSMVTQALTSPWMVVRIPRGGFAAVWFRSPDDGRLFAVARAND